MSQARKDLSNAAAKLTTWVDAFTKNKIEMQLSGCSGGWG